LQRHPEAMMVAIPGGNPKSTSLLAEPTPPLRSTVRTHCTPRNRPWRPCSSIATQRRHNSLRSQKPNPHVTLRMHCTLTKTRSGGHFSERKPPPPPLSTLWKHRTPRPRMRHLLPEGMSFPLTALHKQTAYRIPQLERLLWGGTLPPLVTRQLHRARRSTSETGTAIPRLPPRKGRARRSASLTGLLAEETRLPLPTPRKCRTCWSPQLECLVVDLHSCPLAALRKHLAGRWLRRRSRCRLHQRRMLLLLRPRTAA